MSEEKRCHDCQVKIGEFHKFGCDMEECPFCNRQLLSCECCYNHLNLDCTKEPIYSQGLTNEQSEVWYKILSEKGLIPYGKETRFDQ